MVMDRSAGVGDTIVTRVETGNTSSKMKEVIFERIFPLMTTPVSMRS